MIEWRYRHIFSDTTGKNVDQASLFGDAVSPEGDTASILFIQHQRMVMQHQRMVMEHQRKVM